VQLGSEYNKAFIGYLSRKYQKYLIVEAGTLLDIPTLMQMFNSIMKFKRDFGYAVFYDEELTINPCTYS
jgi:hypothetical protein